MNACKLKNKLFIVITLVLILAGMTVFGIFGFNQTVDYSNSYEVRVSVDQGFDGATDLLIKETNYFFAENGIKSQAYAFQKAEDGSLLIYKFNKQVPTSFNDLQKYLNDKLSAAEFTSATAKVEVNQVIGNKKFDAGVLSLALGISALVIFVYALIMEKLAASVATLGSSVVSFLLFLSLTAILRIPAYPFVSVGLALSVAIPALLSIASARKMRLVYKSKDKPNSKEIAQAVINNEGKKYLFTLIALLVGAVAISALFVPYMMFVGAQIAVVGISSVVSAYFVTPLIWSGIKG